MGVGVEGRIGGGAAAGYSTRYHVGTSDCDTRRRPKGHPSSCLGGRNQLSGRGGGGDTQIIEKELNKQTNV